ncbi:MAG: Flp pilus assembly protein CpaB [Anaerolineae bacterium]|nr:Flp pilus assembly protein CpaB [Anaerolineae bacterium]
MRRRRTFLIVFAVLLIVLLGGLTALVVLRRGQTPAPTPGPGPSGTPVPGVPTPTAEPEMRSVVVVVQPIRRGERIPPDALEIRKWEASALPGDPVTSLDLVVGGYATVDLTPPQPLSASKVKMVTLQGSDIALAIPTGKVAYSFPMRVVATVAQAVRPGDRIDVMISWKIVEVDQDVQIKLPVTLLGGEDCLAGCQPTGQQIPGLVTQYTVQNALVLGVGLYGEEMPGVSVTRPGGAPVVPPTPTPVPAAEGEAAPPVETGPVGPPLSQIIVITVAVDPQSAVVLKWALESDSSMDLVLRSALDEEEFAQPEAVTLEYMVNRYQISLPPRLPHAMENIFQYKLIDEAERFYVPPATTE